MGHGFGHSVRNVLGLESREQQASIRNHIVRLSLVSKHQPGMRLCDVDGLKRPIEMRVREDRRPCLVVENSQDMAAFFWASLEPFLDAPFWILTVQLEQIVFRGRDRILVELVALVE